MESGLHSPERLEQSPGGLSRWKSLGQASLERGRAIVSLCLCLGTLGCWTTSQSLRADRPNDVEIWEFTAKWCGACQQMTPTVSRLQRSGFPIRQIDVDQQQDLARQYHADFLPTFVLVSNGREIKRLTGSTTEQGLRDLLRLAPVPSETQDEQANEGSGRRDRGEITRPDAGTATRESSQASNSRPDRNRDSYGDNRSSAAGGSRRRDDIRTRDEARGEMLVELGQPGPWPRDALPGREASPRREAASDRSANVPRGPMTTDDRLAARDRANPSRRSEPARDRATNGPVIRGQDRGNDPNRDAPPASPELVSAVRIRVRDRGQTRFGSGTSILSQAGRTVVLTCSHLFDGLSSDATIEVDLLATMNEWSAQPAKVLRVDSEADLGLLELETREIWPVSPVTAAGQAISLQSYVYSVGCAGGDFPTRYNVKIRELNPYPGPQNLECTGLPMQGRSGGGLFLRDGRLLGVCIGAISKKQCGAFTGPEPIAQLLAAAGLGKLIPSDSEADRLDREQDLAARDSATGASGPARATGSRGTGSDRPNGGDRMAAGERTATGERLPNGELPAGLSPQDLASLAAADDAEIVCFVRPRGANSGQQRIVVIQQASSKLMGFLADDAAPASTTASQVRRPTAMEVSDEPLPAERTPTAGPDLRYRRSQDR